MVYDLPFEQPLAEIEQQMIPFQDRGTDLSLEEHTRFQELQDELRLRTRAIYSDLTSWQTVQVARHKDRPHATDYLRLMCDDFFELHGDHVYGDDHAILTGPALLAGQTIMCVCQQKGHTLQEKQHHNFGMPHPEGYRKAHRVMQQAEAFGFPILCLIDTPGAFPGLEDEERGQSKAIALNLSLMASIRVPILSVVIGEGGSGGALAIGVADRLLMLEHSIYTVAAPEAAASILWRDTAFAPHAAEAMRVSARELQNLGLIDGIVPEPLGGAHRHHAQTAETLKEVLLKHLTELKQFTINELLEMRYQKFRAIGVFKQADKL